MRLRPALSLVLALLVLEACLVVPAGTARSYPTPATSFDPVEPRWRRTSGLESFGMGFPSADLHLGGREMVFRPRPAEQEEPRRWTVPPAELVLRAFEAAGLERARRRCRVLVNVHVSSFEGTTRFGPVARIAFTLRLTGAVRASRSFETTEPLRAATPEALARGAEVALTRLRDDAVDWLASLDVEG